jgi:hypothetical protein
MWLTLKWIVLSIMSCLMLPKHGSSAFAAVQWVPNQVLPIFCNALTGLSSPTMFRCSFSFVVPIVDLLKNLIIAFSMDISYKISILDNCNRKAGGPLTNLKLGNLLMSPMVLWRW